MDTFTGYVAGFQCGNVIEYIAYNVAADSIDKAQVFSSKEEALSVAYRVFCSKCDPPPGYTRQRAEESARIFVRKYYPQA